ncbi:hypothetical protein DRP53_05340 [candidate division WOR-3 bacterium]|uniref:Tetratricopeptide repeat protein n=1 Tax=candidate division WOR-3 bacterium TaxID=2052148 RepID=A0A660SHT2_UNCW3|nr:MAG: hypothetical protein DRP53_05340 [candidate division WOR-3 bacterium]
MIVFLLALSGISPLGFANHLYESGDYDLALLEYYRYHLSHPDEAFPLIAISECYLKLGRYDRIPQVAVKLPSPIKEYILGRANFYQGKFDSSITILKKLNFKPARILTGLAYGHLFRFDSLARYLGTKPPRIPHRSPAIAGFLAVFPGLGHCYSGRYYDGLFAFFFTGLFSGVGYLYLRDEEKTKATICFTLSGIFWLGNIIGAINAASDFNYFKRIEYLSSLMAEYPEEEFSPTNLWR